MIGIRACAVGKISLYAEKILRRNLQKKLLWVEKDDEQEQQLKYQLEQERKNKE